MHSQTYLTTDNAMATMATITTVSTTKIAVPRTIAITIVIAHSSAQTLK